MGALVKVTMMTSLDPQHLAIGNNANNTSCASPALLTEVYLAKDWLEWGFVTLFVWRCKGLQQTHSRRGARCASTFAVFMLQKENYITKQNRDVTDVSRCVCVGKLKQPCCGLWPKRECLTECHTFYVSAQSKQQQS